MNYQFEHLACGGTFDHLHKGHKAFLNFAFKAANKISIGVTTDRMVKKNGKNGIESQSLRLKRLHDFLKRRRLSRRYRIVTLDDIYGTTISDKTLQGLVVTDLTITGAKLINNRRKQFGLERLVILICPIILDDTGTALSSTRIRQGIVSRDGFSYFNFLTKHRRFILPQILRGNLAKPLGKVQENPGIAKNSDLVVAIGDETTKIMVAKDHTPNLSIVDFKVERREVYRSPQDLGFAKKQKLTVVSNKSGTIDKSLVLAIDNFFKQKHGGPYLIRVLGEEDLAVIPAVLLAPIGTTIIYGQRGVGLVNIIVTENKKAQFLAILKQFRIS